MTPLERSSLISLLPGNQSIPGVDFLIRPHFVCSRNKSNTHSLSPTAFVCLTSGTILTDAQQSGRGCGGNISQSQTDIFPFTTHKCTKNPENQKPTHLKSLLGPDFLHLIEKCQSHFLPVAPKETHNKSDILTIQRNNRGVVAATTTTIKS